MDSVKTTVARLVTVLAASTVVLLAAALPAAAHTYLEGSEPGEGATVSEEVTGIVLEFNQAVNQTIAAIEVTAPDGTSLGDGPVRIDEAVVQRAIAPPPVEGRYVVSWRIVASDGHPLKGRFAFRYEGPVPEPEPTAEPTTPGDAQEPAPDETAASGTDPSTEETPTEAMAPGSASSPAPMAGMADDTVQIADSGAPVPPGRLSLLAGVTLAVLLAAALAIRGLRRWNPPIEPSVEEPAG